jgi:hypothetical protein
MANNNDDEDYLLYTTYTEMIDMIAHQDIRMTERQSDRYGKQIRLLLNTLRQIEPDPIIRIARIARGRRIGAARAGVQTDTIGKGLVSFYKKIAPKKSLKKYIYV